ncbi:hypothetical protein BHE90_011970 [Fusarium euwallaceae]|uniref:Uncharacterized protein n=1 Tax=Fusarium euwallaceae TaxID=1147111 RepID=A0A430LD26_9HYPO|nr:hypothetical protein BHE90_011970 [Fusarium euwallaceae]
MESFRAGLESRMASRPRLSTPAKVLVRVKKKRPTISAPIGPIKNSRGPDLTRSESFMIVPGIKDCTSEEIFCDNDDVEAKKAARRISAGFSEHGSLTSPPMVAKSAFNATRTSRIPSSKNSPPSLVSLRQTSNGSLMTSSSYSGFPSLETIVQDENVPPGHEDSPPLKENPKPAKSRLPKSRTMNALSELKNSISKPSLNSRPANLRGDQSRQVSSSSSMSIKIFSSSSSRLRLPRPSLTSLSRRSSGSSTLENQEPPDPRKVSSAQPSEYWSGRFVSLNDRFSAEEFEKDMAALPFVPPSEPPQKQAIKPDRAAANFRPTHLSHSTTTSALTALTSSKPEESLEDDEDARCIRIFRHLDCLCSTNEARRSLRDWQQTYARRMRKPGLLPKGGRMEDQTLMEKILSNIPRKNDRRVLSAMREAPNVQGARKASALPGATVAGRKKRLAIH